MAAPTPYALAYDFTSFQSSNPTTPLPADKLEIEFNALQTTTDELIANLGAIQRSDNALANNSVGNDQLKSEVTIGVNPAADWVTGTEYEANDTVYESNKVYRCLIAHTAGVFATDLAALKWTEILDFDQYLTATAADVVSTEADLVSVEADLASVESDLSAVESDAGAVETDLAAMEADLATITGDVAAVESDLAAVEADLSATEGDSTATAADLVSVESDLGAVETDLASVESDLSATEGDSTATAADLVSVEADLSATESDLSAVETDLAAVENDRTAVEAIEVPGRNRIINGDFNIWQRGTSFPAIAHPSYSADRWRYFEVSSAVHTISRSTDVPTVAEAGRLFNYSMLVDCTTADASIAAGDLVGVHQRIEGYNFLPIAQKAFTISFWVKATKTGIYCVSARNGGGTPDRSYVSEYTINTTDTWEKKTVTVSASPTAGTWNYTNGTGVSITFALAAGSTFQTTADAWNTGDFIATSNQVNACDSASNDFRICGVQVEAGSAASDFEDISFLDSLMLCQRYYEDSDGESGYYRSQVDNTGQYGDSVKYKVTKRANPTLTSVSVSVILGTEFNTDPVTFTAATTSGFTGKKTAIGTSGDRGFTFAWNADCEL